MNQRGHVECLSMLVDELCYGAESYLYSYLKDQKLLGMSIGTKVKEFDVVLRDVEQHYNNHKSKSITLLVR